MTEEVLNMYDVIHVPVCIDCGKGICFHEVNEVGGVVVGKCGCLKERVMTKRQYAEFEALDDVVMQSMILCGLNSFQVNIEKRDVSEFGRDELVMMLRKLKLLKDV
jgi:hypothetical protein